MPRNGIPTRTRILAAAERLVIDNGFTATTVDQVIAESGTSKGAFFHHFASKGDLAVALVERYAAGDRVALDRSLDAVTGISEPKERLLAFLDTLVDEADELMATQSSCLYVATLTERQLVDDGTSAAIVEAIVAWREAIVELLTAALPDAAERGLDLPALADHVFVTFEGTFLLARATSDPGHMRRQLGALRTLFAACLS